MPSLREIKDRIASVRSTLKITSAMKLVSSSKLRRAQKAIEVMRPYEAGLRDILNECASLPASVQKPSVEPCPGRVVVAIASNGSLCGAFNTNVFKAALPYVCEGSVVFSLGRKISEQMKRSGYSSAGDFQQMIAHPSYADALSLSGKLAAGVESGEYREVILVYTHFVSNARQEVVAEKYLPVSVGESTSAGRYVLEPGREQLRSSLMPKVLALKLYAAVLDSAAAEQAARTLAMQTASDNAEDLLAELSLEYNKSRQQKITAEILDIIGGAKA